MKLSEQCCRRVNIYRVLSFVVKANVIVAIWRYAQDTCLKNDMPRTKYAIDISDSLIVAFIYSNDF